MRLSSRFLTLGFFIAAALAAGAASDLLLNQGRLLGAATGQTDVEAACLPELMKALAERGFSPSDIEFGQRPGLGFIAWPNRTFKSDFTFQDGPAATRIDGVMACEVGKDDVRVDIRTDARPVRAT